MNSRPNMMRLSGLVFLWVTIFSGCDMGSYNPIARSLDPFEPMGSTARGWIAASGPVGNSQVIMLLLQQGTPANTDQGAYVWFEAHDESSTSNITSTQLVRGLYEISGTTILFQPKAEYNGSYKQTSSPSNFPAPIERDGEAYTYIYSTVGNTMTLSPAQPNELVLTSLDGDGGVLDDIYTGLSNGDSAIRDPAAARFMLVYQIGIYASQMIIPGFGGTGMMTYYNNETPFNGLLSGSTRVLMSSLLPTARVDFNYDYMINVPGLDMEGLLRTDSNASGTGTMSETVDVVVDDLDNGSYTVSVSYDGISITGTIPDSGDSYNLTIDTGSGPEDSAVATDVLIPGNIDFVTIMP